MYVSVCIHSYVRDRYRFGLGCSINVFWIGESMFGMFAFNVLYGMCVYVSFKFGMECCVIGDRDGDVGGVYNV